MNTHHRPFDPNAYGPVWGPLIEAACALPPLDAGTPDSGARERLQGESVGEAWAHTTLGDPSLGECCLAGVWLLHNCLDEAHALCQDIPTPSGSYWHGIVHRREGDDSNAKYWFHQAGDHPAGEVIAASAAKRATTAHLAENGNWDAGPFVDLCRRALDSHDKRLMADCLALQQAEWQALFDWCYQGATR